MSPRPVDSRDSSEGRDEPTSTELTETAETLPTESATIEHDAEPVSDAVADFPAASSNASARAASRARRIGGSVTAPAGLPAQPKTADMKAAETTAPKTSLAKPTVTEPKPAEPLAESEETVTRPGRLVPRVRTKANAELEVALAESRSPGASRRWALASIAAAVAVGLVIANVLVWHPWRHSDDTAKLRDQMMSSVKQSAAMAMTYDYRTFDKYIGDTEVLLTGEFKKQYHDSMVGKIKSLAQSSHTVAVSKVNNAGLISINDKGTQAVVMVFAERTVTNTANPDPKVEILALRFTADKVGSKWLLSKLDYL